MPGPLGLQLPFGIQPVNPVPVDTWSGPYSANTEAAAISAANSSIPAAIRFQSMEVRLIIGGVAHKYWYRDGIQDADLVEFSSGSGASNSQTVTTVEWSFMEVPSGGVDGTNNVFYLANSPEPSISLMLFVNGVLQLQGANYDYTLAGATINTSLPLEIGSKIVATYSYVSAGNSIAWMEIPTGVTDGNNENFSLSNAPNPPSSLMFFVNGVLQMQNHDYTLSGQIVTLVYPPISGDNLSATYSY